MKRIVWLASWYPNQLTPYNGDFIRRHAEAVSLYVNVHVIHVIKDEQGKITRDVFKEEKKTGRLTETVVYYHSPKTGFSLFDKFASERKYRKLFHKEIEEHIRKNGKPFLIHVHVGMKAGTMALWAKKKWGIPFVVTEHWSGFLKEAKDNFSRLPSYSRRVWEKLMTMASGCSAVSDYLANAIQKYFPVPQPRVISNVVNTDIFFPDHVELPHPQFIHISGLDELKNPEAILHAFKIVLQHYPTAKMEMIGSLKQEVIALAATLGLKQSVNFSAEVPQTVLARHINKSDALILYSSYETFGCVLIEANACGVPVIVSDIPVFHERVKNRINGLFAQPGNPDSLAEKMMELVSGHSSFDRLAIAAMTRSMYDYKTIGNQFIDWYNEIVPTT